MTDRTDAAIDRAFGWGVMAGLSAARKSPEYEEGVRKEAERMIAEARSISRGERAPQAFIDAKKERDEGWPDDFGNEQEATEK